MSKTTTTKTGYAALTATTQNFLDTCPAVISWTTIDHGVHFSRDDEDGTYTADLASFEFDPTCDVTLAPDGVDFCDDGPMSEYVTRE